ncbi:362b3026-1c1c-47d8-9f68-87feb2847856 [Thermothielavioides terrestris]|uniref:362b3026-1c1c-47d8-9f68-87feb2847856 n=1 Tax=Thermothielavioides terrestris TaxID=2587410 RepID=A0A3S4B7H9_9PEZI|nr:362b3026-1c1c-47d8-9f68-87feb2847856 [Thermothielavioides terrestris]
MTVLYVPGIEAWKYTKRKFNILDNNMVVSGTWLQGEKGAKKLSKSMGLGNMKHWLSGGGTKSNANSVGGLTPATTRQTDSLPPV